MATTRDYSALQTAPTPAEVTEFRRASNATGRFGRTFSAITVAIGLLIGLAFVAIVGVLITGAITVVLASGFVPFELPPLVGPVVAGGLQLALIVIVVALYRRAWRTRWERLLRMSRFAERNGFVFSPRDANPRYPGAIFQTGDSRAALDHFYAAGHQHLDFGNYRFTTGSDKDRTTHTWGFLAMRLERRLPHLLLDARSNNGLFGVSNLPVMFRANQTLSLEGDFDRHFRLYCPAGYEQDALYILTPDVMASLIDEAGTFDLEIVDDWLFAYSPEPFRMDDAATVQRILRVVDTVGAKTRGQTARYADARNPVSPSASPLTGRLDDNTIASPGRRLRQGAPVLFIVLAGGIVLAAGAVLLLPF